MWIPSLICSYVLSDNQPTSAVKALILSFPYIKLVPRVLNLLGDKDISNYTAEYVKVSG